MTDISTPKTIAKTVIKTVITMISQTIAETIIKTGHPIVGDPIYGVRGERLELHAAGLVFEHPLDGLYPTSA